MLKRSTRTGAALLAVILMLAVIPAAGAETVYAMVSGASALNVRAYPSTSGQWLGQVPEGAWVEEVYPAGDNWYYCRVVDSKLAGYMSGAYLKTTGSSSGGGSGTGVVNNPVRTQYLNLREYPSYSARVLGHYYNGTVCQVLSYSGGWYYVMVSGKLGYFKAEYVKVNGGTGSIATVYTRNGGRLNMRSAPSLSGTVLAQYAVGTQVTILLKGTVWCKVSVNGRTGYMQGVYLRTGAGSVPAPTAAPYVTTNPGWPTTAPWVWPTTAPWSWPTTAPWGWPTADPWSWPTTDPWYPYGMVTTPPYDPSDPNTPAPVPVPWPTATPYWNPTGTGGAYCVVSTGGASSYLNLRAQPSTSAKVLAQCVSGARLDLIEQGDTWCRVYDSASGQVGYVMTRFVTVYPA